MDICIVQHDNLLAVGLLSFDSLPNTGNFDFEDCKITLAVIKPIGHRRCDREQP